MPQLFCRVDEDWIVLGTETKDRNDCDGFERLHDDQSDRRLAAALDRIISHLVKGLKDLFSQTFDDSSPVKPII